MKHTPLENKVIEIIRPAIETLGYSLVNVTMTQTDRMPILQIMAEDPKTRRLDLGGCEAISNEVSALLDVDDPINQAYRLEVSSPGIDRPLLTLEDFQAYIGQDVKVELSRPTEDGRKRYRGLVSKAEDEKITLEFDNTEAVIELSDISKARLVLTDALIKFSEKMGL